jgi:hypothetical protein
VGESSHRNVIALGYPRLARAQSRPSANIGQVRIGLDSLCHAALPQGDAQQPLNQLRVVLFKLPLLDTLNETFDLRRVRGGDFFVAFHRGSYSLILCQKESIAKSYA